MRPPTDQTPGRRQFLKRISAVTMGAIASPHLVNPVSGNPRPQKEMTGSRAIRQGKANVVTVLHTSDIHAQLYTHDEFFVENGQVIYKKRGGFAVLKTMLNRLRSENPGNVVLIDGGDCFQGGGLA